MNTIAANTFFRKVSDNKETIESLLDSLLESKKAYIRNLFDSFHIVFICFSVLRKIEQFEQIPMELDDGQIETLRSLKDDLEKFPEAMESLAEEQEQNYLGQLFKNLFQGLAESFEDKIENLALASDKEIRDLITSIDDKTS